MEFASLLGSPRARRCFRGKQKRSRSPISLLDQVDGGAMAESASWFPFDAVASKRLCVCRSLESKYLPHPSGHFLLAFVFFSLVVTSLYWIDFPLQPNAFVYATPSTFLCTVTQRPIPSTRHGLPTSRTRWSLAPPSRRP